jgi:hypothetical protein
MTNPGVQAKVVIVFASHLIKPCTASLGKVPSAVVVIHIKGGERQAIVAVQRVASISVIQILECRSYEK